MIETRYGTTGIQDFRNEVASTGRHSLTVQACFLTIMIGSLVYSCGQNIPLSAYDLAASSAGGVLDVLDSNPRAFKSEADRNSAIVVQSMNTVALAFASPVAWRDGFVGKDRDAIIEWIGRLPDILCKTPFAGSEDRSLFLRSLAAEALGLPAETKDDVIAAALQHVLLERLNPAVEQKAPLCGPHNTMELVEIICRPTWMSLCFGTIAGRRPWPLSRPC